MATTEQTHTTAKVTNTMLGKLMCDLTNILGKHEIEKEAKREIEDVIRQAKREKGLLATWSVEPQAQAKVSTFHTAVKHDLEEMYNCLTMQINGVKATTQEALRNTGKVLQEAEESKATAKELANKVSKVTETADKIASETTTYQDAILSPQKHTNRVSTDPRILNDMECKAKQILVEIFDVRGNNTLAKSIPELVKKANETIVAIEDTRKPKSIKVESVQKTGREALLLTLDSKESVTWIKDPGNEMEFTKAFPKGSHIRD
jgi:hypothetical protein